MLRNAWSIFLRRKKTVAVICICYLLALHLLPRLLFTNSHLMFTHVFEDSTVYCNTPEAVTGDEGSAVDGFELVQVQVLIRHGDRAPIHPSALPNTSPMHISCLFKNYAQHADALDRFRRVARTNRFLVENSHTKEVIDERQWCKPGQLTPYGHLQHLYIGKHLKQRYRLLLRNISTDDFFIQSTDVPRTIRSVASLLSTWLPAIKGISPLKIQVFPDHIEDGHLILSDDYKPLKCPNLSATTKLSWSKDGWKNFRIRFSKTSEDLATALDADRKQIPSIGRIVDVLYTRQCHGQGVPHGPSRRIPAHLVTSAFAQAHEYTLLHHGPVAEHQSLSILSQMAQQILNRMIGESPKRFVFYSGHDTMIAPFLLILGISDGKWPKYASRIVVEFYTRKDETPRNLIHRIELTYFRVLYNGKAAKYIKFCKSVVQAGLCPLTDLFSYVTDGLYNPHFESMDKSTFQKILFTRIKDICS